MRTRPIININGKSKFFNGKRAIAKKKQFNKIKALYQSRDNQKNDNQAKIAGRVVMIRNLGKLIFSTLQDSKGRIQIILQNKETQADSFDLFILYWFSFATNFMKISRIY